MRSALFTATALALACAAPPAPDDDPLHRAMATVAGFHDANLAVARRLDESAGWAVFPNAVPGDPTDARPGFLFTRDHRTLPVELHSTTPRRSPIGRSRHVLVVLADRADVDRIAEGRLALEDAAHVIAHDEGQESFSDASTWIVSSALSGLLFEPDVDTGGWEIVAVGPSDSGR
ncbi:MAG: hypothetical protein AAF726_07045 [Planctomycetota bacterium]